MSKDIDKWVSQCVECQKSALTIKQETKPIPIEVSQPFELVGMDLIGKVVKTEAGNEYIAVMIDYFTKWSEAYPLPSKTAADVAQCILKFFYRFGAPKRILTDQGKEFVNELNKELCKMLNIERSLCAPYHPQTNGLVEKHNGTIQRALCKLVSERPETWDTYLDRVMFGIRTKKQSTTKFSPYFLLFGRQARLPCEVPENILIDSKIEDTLGEESVVESIRKRDAIYKLVQENMEKTHKKYKTPNQKPQTFKVGDKVLRLNIRSQQRKGGKLERNWTGPYTIVKLVNKSADLQSETAFFPKVNTDQLKIFIEQQNIIPQKILKTGKPASIPPPVEETTFIPPPVEETTSSPPPPEETTSSPPPPEETTSSPPPLKRQHPALHSEETTSSPPPPEETTSSPPPPEETTSSPHLLKDNIRPL
ncbi:unnamed protein product [Knipowitschia caucasica]